MQMSRYEHTQRGTLIWVTLLVFAAVMSVLAITVSLPILIVVPVLLVAGWLFHSLTIEVTESELRWVFGPGLIRRRVPLADIASAQPVRTNFIEGWGIHYSRFGWLYNVSGFDAVAVVMNNGKRFALGSDEPQKLADVLRTSQSASR